MSEKLRLYFLSFIEGACVMIVELCCAKLMAPYFGTSIDVWANTLSVSLLGLATGYFIGSNLSLYRPNKNKSDLRLVILLAAVLIVITPMYYQQLLTNLLNLSLKMGSFVGLLIVLFPILMLLGCTSPLIINIIDKSNDNAGQTSGRVYTVSTLGGIVFTLITGYFFIPHLGLKLTLLITGAMLGASILIQQNIKSGFNILIFGLLTPLILTSAQYERPVNRKFKILHESDGLLGNIKIMEHTSEMFGGSHQLGRGMVVNNTLQTLMSVNDPNHSSIWAWSNIIPTAISFYPENSDVLLCGLGGSTIVKQLQMLRFDFDVVELDERMQILSQEYFHLDKSVNVIIDDARHFVRTSDKSYDVIIFDTFLSESAPEHLLTKEALKDVQNILNPNGLLLTNFYGFTSGEKGYAARSVVKTYIDAGFFTYVLASPGKEDGRNIFVIGSKSKIDFSKVDYEETDGMRITDLTGLLIPREKLDLNDAEVLTDNNPKLSILYRDSANSWKKGYNRIYTKEMYK